jgi:hypothetical protein
MSVDPFGPSEPVGEGDRVVVMRPDDDCSWFGRVVRRASSDELEVQADDQEFHLVPVQYARLIGERSKEAT